MFRSVLLPAALVAAALSIGGPSALAQTANKTGQVVTEVVTLATRTNVTVTYVVTRKGAPTGTASAAVILLAGGNGAIKIGKNGSIGGLGLNFLIRSRDLFLQNDVSFVAAVDAPSDRPNGMNGAFRLSQAHADDLAKVIDDVRSRSGLPVWLVGTSAGTLSVAGAAGRLANKSTLAGVVFTSTMTQLDALGHCGKSVFDASLGVIKVPALIVSHANDGCVCSPAAKADELLKTLASSQKKEKRIFTGGLPPVSAPCDALAQHGYYGIEKAVVSFIASWIKPPQSQVAPSQKTR